MLNLLKLLPSFLIILIFILFSLSSSLNFDESFYGLVSKNFAIGNNFSTSFHQLSPHDVGITTGPALLAPNALSIVMFGNTADAIRLGRLLIITLLLLSTAFLLRHRVSWSTVFSLFFTLIFFFSTETSGSIELGFLRLAYQNLGDLPAAIMAVLSTVTLSIFPHGVIIQFIAGVLWGLTLTTKLITAILFSGFFFTLLLMERLDLKNLFDKYKIFFLGLLFPPLYWYILGPFFSYGFKNGLFRILRNLKFIGGAGSGAGEIIRATSFLEKIQTNFFSNIGKLAVYLEGYPFLVLLFAVIIYALIDLFILDKNRKIFPTALIFGGFLTLLWWIFLPERGWIRHLYPGFMAMMFGLSVYILEKKGIMKWVLSACAILILLPRYHYFLELKNIPVQDEPRKIAQMETVEFIKKMQATEPKPVLLSCGDLILPDLEYLLPGALNFKNCFWLNPEDYSGHPVYLVKTKYWFPDSQPYLAEAEKLCPEQIFKKEDFEIWKCFTPEKFSLIEIPEGMKKKVF